MAVEWWIHGSGEPCGNVMSRPHGPHSWESCVVEIIGNGARLWVTSESELCSLASVCWDRDVSHSKFTNISITIIVIKTDTADHSCCTAPHLAVRELDGSGEPQSLFFFFLVFYWGEYGLFVTVTVFKTCFYGLCMFFSRGSTLEAGFPGWRAPRTNLLAGAGGVAVSLLTCTGVLSGAGGLLPRERRWPRASVASPQEKSWCSWTATARWTCCGCSHCWPPSARTGRRSCAQWSTSSAPTRWPTAHPRWCGAASTGGCTSSGTLSRSPSSGDRRERLHP